MIFSHYTYTSAFYKMGRLLQTRADSSGIQLVVLSHPAWLHWPPFQLFQCPWHTWEIDIQGLGKVTTDIGLWLKNSSIFTHPLIPYTVSLYQHFTHGLYSSSRFLHLSPFAIRFVKFDSQLGTALPAQTLAPSGPCFWNLLIGFSTKILPSFTILFPHFQLG